MSTPEATTVPQETSNDVEAVIAAPTQQRGVQRPLAYERQRWDTEVSQVEVTGNDASDPRLAAVKVVTRNPDCVLVLSVYPEHERGPHGYRVWNVEWIATWTEEAAS